MADRKDKSPAITAMVAGLLGDNEAQAATSKWFEKAFNEARKFSKEYEILQKIDKNGAKQMLDESKFKDGIDYGTIPDRAYGYLREIDPSFVTNEVKLAIPHGALARTNLSDSVYAKMYKDALDDFFLTAIRNKPGNDRTGSALWYQGKKLSTVLPVKNVSGQPLVLTGVPTPTKDIQKYLLENRWGLGGRNVPSIDANPTLDSLGIRVPSRQPLRTLDDASAKLSAVNPTLGNTLNAALAKVKNGAKAAIPVATTGKALSSDDAFASDYQIKEKPLEEPFIDPIDVAISPVGAVGGPKVKLKTMGSTTAISAMLKSLFGE